MSSSKNTSAKMSKEGSGAFPELDDYKATAVFSELILLKARRMGLDVNNLKPSAVLRDVFKPQPSVNQEVFASKQASSKVAWDAPDVCPKCGSKEVYYTSSTVDLDFENPETFDHVDEVHCNTCGAVWPFQYAGTTEAIPPPSRNTLNAQDQAYLKEMNIHASKKTAMTPKDYILIANVLKECLNQVGSEEVGYGVHLVIQRLGDALKQDNPQFNMKHFVDVVNSKKELNSRPQRPVNVNNQVVSSSKKASDVLGSLDKFTQDYLEAALWSMPSECDDEGNIINENPGDETAIIELPEETIAIAKADCTAFQIENALLLEQSAEEGERRASPGHDFCLTRNRHGVGFWEYKNKELGEALTRSSHEFGENTLYTGDDGLLYWERPAVKAPIHPTQASAKRRLAGAKLGGNITPELINQARELIDRDDPIIYDVAADVGQIVDNVKHMSWFAKQVAEWLSDDPSYYAEATNGPTEGAVAPPSLDSL
jgi:DNA-directed RNA polymerase subunit M/transcription elongation factor TFIIS